MSDDDQPEMALTWSPECAEIFSAMAEAQSNLGDLLKGKKADAGSYNYNYADLPSTLDACLGALNSAGCAVFQPARVFNNGADVTTVITHSSGQWIMAAPLFMPVKTAGAQDVGSAITYARRYALQAMVGLSPSDDDGAKAQASAPDKMDRQKPKPRPTKPRPSNLGPRCTGKAGNIAVAIEQRLAEVAKREDMDMDAVYDWAVGLCAIDVDKYGSKGYGRAETLTIPDGKLVSAALARRLGESEVAP